MTALTTESRGMLSSALQGLGLIVYDVVPATPTTPSVSIIPDTPWITPERISSHLQYEVRWKLLLAVKTNQNKAAQNDSEKYVDFILGALTNSHFNVSLVGPPQLTDVGAQGTVLTTEINVSVSMKE
jgi:hypothetical protein